MINILIPTLLIATFVIVALFLNKRLIANQSSQTPNSFFKSGKFWIVITGVILELLIIIINLIS